MKLLLLTAIFVGANGISLFGADCDDKKNIFRDNSNACAVVYDEDDCKKDSQVIPVGYTRFNGDLKNDVEAVMVRPGCVMVGYSNNRGNGDEFFEGENAVLDASSRTLAEGPLIIEDLNDDYKHLNEDMESADCYCQNTAGVGNVPKLSSTTIESNGFFDNLLGHNRASKCNQQVAIFNRPGPGTPKALLFDEPGCNGRMKEVGEGYTSLTRLIGESLDDDVESVLVRPGCKFTGTDHGKANIFGRGSKIVIDATNSNEPKAKNLSGDSELDEDISAVDVEC